MALWLRRAALLVLAALLAACATQTQSLLNGATTGLPRNAELAATPFYPQQRYQCGPAALAMVLAAAGMAATPDALVGQVYVPAREGSLQPEMLAAGRRHGALSVAIAPRIDALLMELAAGNPVVVLQNLSLPWFPLWHYAVAIGYDLDREEIILRSGTTQRLAMPMSTFEHTWARSGYWGMVALPLDRLPATASEDSVVDALVALEKSAGAANARRGYEVALHRWPANLTLQLGLGNAAYAAGDLQGAEDAFRHASERHPESAPAFNNLASVMAELGRLDEARQAAEKAVALGGQWREEALATLRSIDQAQRKKPGGQK